MDWIKGLFVMCAVGVISLGALFLAHDATAHAQTSGPMAGPDLIIEVRQEVQTAVERSQALVAGLGDTILPGSLDSNRDPERSEVRATPEAAATFADLGSGLDLNSTGGPSGMAGSAGSLAGPNPQALAQSLSAGPGPNDCSQPYQSMDWLDLLNDFRSLASLPPVSENPEWSYGDCLHSRYLVKNDLVLHDEDPGNPWYTPEGAQAGIYSNVLGGGISGTDEEAVARWMEAAYHGLWMINPDLREVGFGSYREQDGGLEMAAALDVIRGIRGTPDSVQFPVMFPGDGERMPIHDFGGGEIPNPLVNCPGYSYPTGPSLFLRYQTTPTLYSHELRRDGSPVESCAFVDGNTVVLLPREPLISATYRVSVQSSQGAHSWSFYFGSAGCFPSTPGACGGGNIDAVHTADRAFDNDTVTFFQASYDEDAWDLYFNYGTPVSIQRVELDYFDQRFIAAHTELKVSRDGVNWVTIGEFSVSDPASLSVGGAYQYLWLAMQGENPQSGYTPAIREVNVLSGSSPPTVAQPAAAEPNPVYGAQATLTVLGQDDGGEGNLTYTWEAISGPSGVSFAPNGDNAAKRSQATFSEAGVYRLQATVRDRDGLQATSAVDVEVLGPECDQDADADHWQGEYWVFDGDLPAEPGTPYAVESRWGARRIREDTSDRYGLGEFLHIDFDAYGGGPNRCQVETDRFFSWMRKSVDFRAGEYTFAAGSDDAIKVWVNDGGWQALEDCTYWGTRPFKEQSCTHLFKTPGRYEIAAAYFENDGEAQVRLTWEGVGLPSATPTTRPSSTPTPTSTSTPRPPDTSTPTPRSTQGSGAVERAVASGTDDSYAYLQYYRWVNGVSERYMIMDSGNWGGLRFTDLPIPQGARITSAYLQVRVDYRDDPALYIYVQAADDAHGFSQAGPQGRQRGSSYTRWQAKDVGDGWVNTPDLATLVQEIVDRPGWSPGNAIAFLWWPTSGSRLHVRQWDFDSGNSAARLIVRYEGGDGGEATATPAPTEPPALTATPSRTPTPTGTSAPQPTATRTATNPPSSSCPVTREGWIGIGTTNEARLGALLPVRLGSEGGRTSYQVKDPATALRFLRMQVGDSSNGVSMLYAEQLAARLNIAEGVGREPIEAQVTEVDEFLAAHTYHDWAGLTRDEKYQVLDWVEALRDFNAGRLSGCP
jgi:hypothetical protein